jgi:selenocysteine-specific elongation factor
VIIATAGHIDHGKTTLVSALTGIDTDRLPEEKSRGMTIDLGFAYRPLESGPVMGFIDVPGHEKFVRNMLAGVAGIDLALLVIAADDGPMAQTEEHLAILDLLGIEQAVVAITKIDIVDPSRVDEVEANIRGLLATTRFGDVPIYRTSGATGDGIGDLAAFLENAARDHDARDAAGNFRLAIDRCFTVAGAGLVVTGTVFSGSTAVDDRLVISPTGTEVRVRSIHAQNQDAETGMAGQRCGINLAGSGLARAGVSRGNWLVAEAVHRPANRLDCRVRLLPGEDRALRHWAPVHVHLGAAETTAHIAMLDGSRLEPGGEAMVQLVLDNEIGAVGRDRLILRDASAQRTIGGGWVIDPFGPSRGRSKPDRIAQLEAMDQAGARAALSALVEISPSGVDEEWFRVSRNLTASVLAGIIEGLGTVRFAMTGGGVIFSKGRWAELTAAVAERLAASHKASPDIAGLDEQALRKAVDPGLKPNIFRAVVEHLTETGTVVRVGAQLALPGHRAELSPEDQALWAKISDILEADPFKPPVVHALAEELGRDPKEIERFMSRVTRMGYLHRTARNRFFLTDAIAELARIAEAVAGASADNRLDIPAFRGASEVGRNLAVEILEAFDKAGLTAREDNKRRILAPVARIFPER